MVKQSQDFDILEETNFPAKYNPECDCTDCTKFHNAYYYYINSYIPECTCTNCVKFRDKYLFNINCFCNKCCNHRNNYYYFEIIQVDIETTQSHEDDN